ncbi:methylthioribulose 1-phosphate dehydratase [Bacteriovorax stolpii]|uniref:methylthioribulose 1-phosphate dehydratase n=1 Tax=Bacteriovorax stolpii TaxID=960 RepID=UPI00115B56FD|nr:methylthioribulose 1-phosphate dehydratase [Bacteriovorax stolpii]QDK40433.1 methylthioribulose 1-phosphate dehydratase [Bacteriovorax stolpii]
MSFIISAQDYEESKKLATLVRVMNSLGHNPATSGNYSLRSKTNPDIALVSESGIDKSKFTEDNFLPLYYQTREMHEDYKASGRKSSDETDIHLTIYQITKANCVLHSHILDSLLFADLFPGKQFATIKNLELLKGFKGIKTHELEINIPVFDNTQDIRSLAEEVKPAILSQPNSYGLLLRGHGIYVWGDSVEEAKRHLEVFEYIFKYYLNSNKRIG